MITLNKIQENGLGGGGGLECNGEGSNIRKILSDYFKGRDKIVDLSINGDNIKLHLEEMLCVDVYSGFDRVTGCTVHASDPSGWQISASRRPLTAVARVQSRTCPCGVCNGQYGIGTFHPCPLHIHSSITGSTQCQKFESFFK
jgi:hypothetical protein